MLEYCINLQRLSLKNNMQLETTISVKKFLTCLELKVDDDFEQLLVS